MNLNYYLRGLGLGMLVTALILGLSGNGKKTMTDSEIKKRALELGMIENTVLTEDADGPEQASGQTDGIWEKIEKEPEPAVETEEVAELEPDVEEEVTGEETAEVLEPVEEQTEEPEPESEPEVADDPEAAGLTEAVDGESVEDEAEAALPAEGEAGEGGKNGIKGTENTEAGDEAEGTSQTVPDGSQIAGEAAKTVILTIVHGDSSYTVARKLYDMGVVPSVEEYDRYLCQNGYDKTIRTGTYEIEAGTSLEQIARMINGK